MKEKNIKVKAPKILLACAIGPLLFALIIISIMLYQNENLSLLISYRYTDYFDSEGKSIPSDEFCPFVPEILFDDKGIGYLRLVAPHWVYTLEDLRIKANALIAVDKEICDHDNFYSGSLRDALIGYEMVQRV